MMRSLLTVKGYKFLARDGEFGEVEDVLFDENLWIIRYLVANTGGWLSGRRVLIPPQSLGKPNWKDATLPVEMDKSGIEQSPPMDEHAPVSRQYEIMLHRYWRLQPYWVGDVTGGAFPIPMDVRGKEEDGREEADASDESLSDPFLRSVKEVTGYNIEAEDDGIGHVDDFLFDDEQWVVRYMVVDTRNWLPGRKVMIPLSWIKEISFADRNVAVDVTREAVKNSPKFDPNLPVNREQEQVLFDYYGRPHYEEVVKK
ncbi:PRC-barrel domain containing protein [candidate division GN15 bacterium]|nr:PRC-barrel domain containing protein [candidate division GN15 bacterium]